MRAERIRILLERERAVLAERTPESRRLFERARRVLAGGVASSFQSREPWPLHLERGEGPRVWDADGNEYLDFHNGFSSMVQGHAHPAVLAATAERAARGAHFAAPTEEAIVVAEELARRFGLPRWRFTNSGSESTMGAIRLARALTGRDDVVRIAGAYHGHHDAVLAGASAGVPAAVAAQVHPVEFNDAAVMERRVAELAEQGRPPACVIMEAAVTSAGLILPEPGYLDAVRSLTRRHGVLLILDEVKTGLTIAPGGAVERFGLEPDMVTLAKTLGAGLPTGAIGMSEEAAALVEDRSVPLFGTFNGNPLAMAAARANLLEVLTPEAYERMEGLGRRLAGGCEAVLADAGLEGYCVALGSKGGVVLGGERVVDHASYRRRHDPELAELCWLWAANRGVFTTAGREPEWNVTVAHDEAAADRYVEVLAGLAAALSPRSSGSARA
jgi:glutamate-1-semialdehyde 2,1-aminomutase